MNFLFRPLWVFFAVSLPQLLLFGACAGTYRLIASQLTQRSLRLWAIDGCLLALLGSAFTLLAVIAARARRPLPTRLGPILLLTYLSFLFTVAMHMHEIVPAGIPRWLLFQGDQLVLVYTLLMPALIYGLFLTVAWLTPDETAQSAWKNFALAVAVPLGWYLLCTGGQAAWRGKSLAAVLPFLLILSALAFLFFLVRAVCIVIAKRQEHLQRYRLLWLAAVSLVFPQLGLALHSGILLGGSLPKGPFGDFSHPAFSLLAAVNGILLCLPTPRTTAARRGLAGARALLLPFTVYFFLVFLPYFPLSVLAIFVFGLGILMLTPLLLMMVHVRALREDFAYLRSVAGAAKSAATLLAAVLVLPALIVAGCLRDRIVLHHALDYVSAPDYSTPEPTRVDVSSLGRVLSRVRELKTSRGREFLNQHVPYLSPLYQYLVLGNLTLADGTIRELHIVFFGSSAIPPTSPVFAASNPQEVAISRISATSVPIDEGRSLRSAIDLEITNNTNQSLEYASSFALPEGAWISGFHLQIGDRREPGILAEKRAAAWVYRRIVTTRRDPGILIHQENGRIGLRIFPLAAGETRKTGFEIVHREPLRLQLDGREIVLGEGREPATTARVVRVGDGEIHYVPPPLKQTLPAVTRTPVLHFIVDCSVAAAPRREEYIRRINRFLAENRFGTSPVRITLADSGATSFDRDSTWERRVREHAAAGGFFLERSVKSILRRQFEERGGTYPIVIVVAESMEQVLGTGGLAGFAFISPETDALFHLGASGKLAAHRFMDLNTAVAGSPAPLKSVPVLAYPSRDLPLAFLPNDGRASVVITGSDLFERETAAAGSPWENALALAGLWRALQLDPVERKRKELLIIRKSFAAGIMTPATSFIALEDEARKLALLAKQRQTLGAHSALDVDESSFEQMSEPGWIPLLGLGLLALAMSVRSGVLRL